ncbi:MAG TPA: nucleoside 2-deoxyribosyltransferase domain-containing protein [Candidatus Paceibacterota bacterium]|nr:nucleoside 2-deoxyribosyltransferase domain-containing protein [Candidatus Paceibacterota bacterium]
MRVVYVHENDTTNLTRSMFLAGPSPRKAGEYDWRKQARTFLHRLGFDGTVFIPLPRDGEFHEDYDRDAQASWELDHLEMAAVRVFWVPRDLVALPGFTTNVEFGRFSRMPPCVLGYPDGTPKMWYLHFIANRDSVPVYHSLIETLAAALKLLPV